LNKILKQCYTYLHDVVSVEVSADAVLVLADGALHVVLNRLVLGVFRRQVDQHGALAPLKR